MAKISLTNPNINSGTEVKLYNGKIGYSWKNDVTNKPLQRAFQNTEVQYNGWENPLFDLTFYIPLGEVASGYITWEQWMSFVKNKPTTTSNTTLNIITGAENVGGSTQFKSYGDSETSSGTSAIPVVIKDFSLSFGPDDSENGYFWTISAKLIETTTR